MAGLNLSIEMLRCPVCLDLLKCPVSIPCGHSFCMFCLESYWDANEDPCCPQCRQSFTPRPVLVKNTLLEVLSDSLKELDGCCASPEDVACDVCVGTKQKAVRSCLQCLVSYCETHLQPHFKSAAFGKHKLVEPVKTLLDEVCTVDENMDMHTRKSEAKRSEGFEVSQKIFQQKIQDKEQDLKQLCEEMESISDCANRALEESDQIFTDFICLMEKRHSDMKHWIRSQQQNEENQFKKLQEKLERDIFELRQRDFEMDHKFLDNFTNCNKPTNSSSSSVRPFFTNMTAAISEFRDKFQSFLSHEWISLQQIDLLQSTLEEPQPKARAELLKYSCEITLDPNTANSRLLLSKNNTTAKLTREEQIYSKHFNRFSDCIQVLSKESLSSRSYFEVDWVGWGFYLAVSYKSIERKGAFTQCRFGHNENSWVLHCEKNSYEFCHNGLSQAISGPHSSKIGVYLDQKVGLLEFYSVRENMVLLHKVNTIFTQPLFAGLLLYSVGDFAEFC